MRKLLAALAVVGLCGAAGSGLAAQSVKVGPQIDFGTDFDLGLGGRAEFDLTKAFSAPLTGAASFDYFFPGAGVHVWEINGNVWYNIKVHNPTFRPYVGGGINIAHYSASGFGFSAATTEAGLNLGGGTKFNTHNKSFTPYAEARVELRTGGEFVLTGGLLF